MPRANSKSGVANNIEVTNPPAQSIHPQRFPTLRIPKGRASNQASNTDDPVNSSVLRALDQRSGATGVLYANENPNSPLAADFNQQT
jgi:hypothetical protein